MAGSLGKKIGSGSIKGIIDPVHIELRVVYGYCAANSS
jgi:hypothetical protein